MPSTSSSSSSTGRRPCKHHVFLSFRGTDTRTSFTGHLYDALTRHGLNTFRDDENLRVGDPIRPELLKAIEESRFGIVVLSRGYAASTWCLEELAHIVEKELIVIPVFYHVDPSDVRYQRKTFGEAFAKHETSNRFPPEKVETWRAALTTVGHISGSHVQGDRYESKVISEIVRRISMDSQDTLPKDATKGLVGIESRVEELKCLLDVKSDEVCFIGICGMSGMGKTTLAEVVFEGIRNQFDRYSFIPNIKDISKENYSDLCMLQQKLLVDILNDKQIRVGNVFEGVRMLQERLCGLKIIIVLDDVNHRDQLKYLAGERKWFGNGSRIIITTTNEDLLTLHRVDEKYKCEGLNIFDATRLFKLSAFKKEQLDPVYEKLSSDIVELAGGLPLALDTFGSLLYGKGEEYWRDTLKKLQQSPEKEVLQRLEICYGRLDRNEQDIFIYIACFLKGRDQKLVNDILENIGLFPVRGIDTLINRSLITINYDDSVWMHDLLQQMGWEIFHKKRLGLKCREEIIDICASKGEGTEAIEIINQEQYEAEVEDSIGHPKSFSKMKKLKFLRISNVNFSDGLKHLSNDLRILKWHGCSLKSFPQTFRPKQIYELDMPSSRLEKLWEKYMHLPNLRSINLRGSEDLTEIPNLTSTPKLLKLILQDCTNLAELHESLLAHKTLRYVNLKGCRNLRSIGNKMEMDGLEALHLSGCSKLDHIPEFGQNMKCLEDLYLDGTKIKRLRESLGEIHSLRKLDVSETAIEELPSLILHLERLRLLQVRRCRLLSLTRTFHPTKLSLLGLKELDLSDCNLSAIPDGIGLLYSLKELDLSENDFVTLPASISLLSNLRMLCLNSCTRLKSLPKLSNINEDTVRGGEIRFSHYISREGLDVSKFRSLSHNINPTLSCLNCPKLIVDYRCGSGFAHTIFHKYLQVRTESRVIPEATFEIVAAGSKIPLYFKLGKSHSVTLKGIETKHYGIWDVFDVDFRTCIGVALCAVIVVPHSLDNARGAYREVKYEVVAHINVADKHRRIPVPINFLEAELETQLVWYWTVTDDLQRAVDPSQRNQCDISFSVEPKDGNLEVKKFGVPFLCQEDIPKSRGPRVSINGIPKDMISLFHGQKMRWHKFVCEANQELQSFNSVFQDYTYKVITILTSGFKHGSISLDSIRQAIESLLEMNQEVVKAILECKEDMPKDPVIRELSPMSWQMLQLCTDFMKFLKRSGDSWLIVQVAMQQIDAKRKAGTLNYRELMQQLSNLERAEVPLSDYFTHLFLSFHFRSVYMIWDYTDRMVRNTTSTSGKAWRKVSHVITAATLSEVLVSAVVVLRNIEEPLPTTTDFIQWMRGLFDWLELHLGLADDKYERWKKSDENYCQGLRITDFDGTLKLLEELKGMDWVLLFSDFATKKDEEEIVILMDEIKRRISGFTNTIEDMSMHAYKCISYIRQVSEDDFKCGRLGEDDESFWENFKNEFFEDDDISLEEDDFKYGRLGEDEKKEFFWQV